MTGLGQIPLIIGAMAILSTLQLSVNSAIVRTLLLELDTEATIDAVAVGQAMVDEILTKEYDEKTIGKNIYNRSELTPINQFGPELTPVNERVILFPDNANDAGEFLSRSIYDDVDDYHRYTRIVISPRLDTLIVSDSICYANETNLDVRSSTQTWYKKIIVEVKHRSLLYPIRLKSLFVYRRFI